MTTKRIDVQSSGRFCLLRDLDHNAFACIFYAAAAAMKAASLLVLRSSQSEYLLVKNSPRLTSARARSFAAVPTSG